MRRCRSSESTQGTMRSLSPLAISVAWVNADRSEGADRPNCSIALSWVRNALMPMAGHGRGCVPGALDQRLRGGLAGRVAVEEEDSLGSERSGSREGCPGRWCHGSRPCPCRPRAGPGGRLRTRSGCFTISILKDHPAHGEGEDVDLLEAERADELGQGVIDSLFLKDRDRAGGGAHPAQVEGDRVPVDRDGVDDAGSQLSNVAARCTKKNDRDAELQPGSR